MALGKQVKKHREARGWTLEKLSDESGVAIGTIGALEARDSKRSIYITQIAKGLGLTVEELAGDTPPKQPSTPTGEVFQVMTAEESELLYNFRALTDDDRATFSTQMAEKAAKTRAHVEKILKAYGLKPHEKNGHQHD